MNFVRKPLFEERQVPTARDRDSHCRLALTDVLKGRETVNVRSNLRIGDVCLVASVAR